MSAVVTISASFGASGNVIGRAVADQLGVPFFDRAVPAEVAKRLSVTIEQALDHDETAPSTLDRVAAAFAYVSTPFGPSGMVGQLDDPDQFRKMTEQILHNIADTTGGVVLGRAGMVVLHDRPDVLRVRLDGPVEDRIAYTMRTQNMTEAATRTMQHDIDGAREMYARVFYRAHQSDLSLYQLVLEATSLGVDVCIAAIVQVARLHLARWLPAATAK